jgi:hypothetical protein
MSTAASVANPLNVFEVKRPEDYHQIGGNTIKGNEDYVMSFSELKRFAKCPRRWMHSPPQKRTKGLNFGSLVDCMVLTPDEFSNQFIINTDFPNFQSNAAKNWRDTMEAGGFTVIAKKDADEAQRVVERIKEDDQLMRILQHSRKQVAVRWTYTDEESGMVVPLKSLVDILPNKPNNSLGDLKTTANAEPRKWVNTIVDYSYHVQAAMYLDGVNQAQGLQRDSFFHIVIESEDPYEPEGRRLSSNFLTCGRLWYRNQLARYCGCVMSGVWPTWHNEYMPEVEPPVWMIE